MSISSWVKDSRIGKFWLIHEKNIVLAIGLILIAGVSFEAGYLHGQKNKNEPIIVNKVATAEVAMANTAQNKNDLGGAKNTPANGQSIPIENTAIATDQKCAYVASKNSNKYHLATCQFAQKIKPENKVCFASADEAIKRGYQGAKCCIK